MQTARNKVGEKVGKENRHCNEGWKKLNARVERNKKTWKVSRKKNNTDPSVWHVASVFCSCFCWEHCVSVTDDIFTWIDLYTLDSPCQLQIVNRVRGRHRTMGRRHRSQLPTAAAADIDEWFGTARECEICLQMFPTVVTCSC